MADETAKYRMNHTMIRIKDPKRSIAFYTERFGMAVLGEMPMKAGCFTNYFLGYPGPQGSMFSREGLLELTHNWGAEDTDWTAHNGNSDPRGFGHICIAVDNVEQACERLEQAGVRFQKKLSDGRQKDIAFVLDPDGYWVEVIGQPKFANVEMTDTKNYKFNHSMVRIKDPERSLPFYSDVLGMTLVRTKKFQEAKFTLFFFAYTHGKNINLDKQPTSHSANPNADQEGLIELTWNWGTESDQSFEGYANGNTDPKGFGHFGISVDDVQAACDRFETLGVKFQKRPQEGSMKNIAFILDPDNYWIEILPSDMRI